MIHYHGTPLSGDRLTQVRALHGRHAMVSFATPDPLPVVADVCQSFCLDNGAFSAWKRGHSPDWQAYADWVSEWMTHPGFDFCVIPDVIDGDHTDNLKLLAKWQQMSRRMLTHSAPVWHMHEPLEVLREYCAGFYRVCIGSSGEYATVGSPAWWRRIAEAMPMVCDESGRPRCKLHGLRMLDPDIYRHLPLASADSTNAGRNAGIDGRWKGRYAPATKETRALILMERIERGQSAERWQGQQQQDLWQAGSELARA